MTQVALAELVAGAIAGKVISFPTDTVPALAVKPDLAKLIFQLKQRSIDKPLILMGASLQDLLPYVLDLDGNLKARLKSIEEYIPGALTLVLEASSQVPQTMNPQNPTTIGIRVPDSAIALSILQQTGPLATTSANVSGEPPLRTMNEIERVFSNVLVLDLGDLENQKAIGSGLPSTVAKWQETSWEILRQGSVSLENLN
jgi:L-threonylcarbamoyladenylate synthase